MDINLLEFSVSSVNARLHHLGLNIMLGTDESEILVNELTTKNIEFDCIDIFFSLEGTPHLLLLDGTQPASYLYFSLEDSVLNINLSRTDHRFRRRRLSTYLRMVLFIYATLDPRIRAIASDTNALSYKLLSKYGFVGLESERGDKPYTVSVSTSSTILRERIAQFMG